MGGLSDVFSFVQTMYKHFTSQNESLLKLICHVEEENS